MVKFIKKNWLTAVGVIVGLVVVLWIVNAFAQSEPSQKFTGADGAASCLTEVEVQTRFSALQGISPTAELSAVINTSEGSLKERRLTAAINTVYGSPLIKDGFSYQTIFIDTTTGKVAMVMFGPDGDQFCDYVIFHVDQVKKIGELVSGSDA